MYKNYIMNQITLPFETEKLIPDDGISKVVHTMIKNIPKDIFGGFRHSQFLRLKPYYKIVFAWWVENKFIPNRIGQLNDLEGI